MNEPFDLTPFCYQHGDDGKARYAIDAPWCQDGWEYATDGGICVRQPSTGLPPVDGLDRPDPLALFAEFPRCRRRWPEHNGKTEKRPCPECKGTRTVLCTCPICEVEHLRLCENCENGKILQVVPMVIANRKIAGRYCLMVQALGDVRYSPKGGRDEPLAFSCGELQGLILGLLPESKGG